jgi:RecA/RadA recombinase
MARKAVVVESGARARAKQMAEIAKRFEAFKPAREVLTVVRAVPTIFVQLDHALRVGGWPLQRVGVIHGRSSEGKTLLALGLVQSFLERGHFALYLDAERTTSIDWVQQLVGQFADHPQFFAVRPDSYEIAVDQVRAFIKAAITSRRDGVVPEDTAAVFVVDSLRKLIPKDHFKNVAAGDSIDGAGGRGPQQQAKFNAAWLDELVPLLDHGLTSAVLIVREIEDPNANIWARKTGDDYKVTGGKAVIYDSSILARVTRAAYVTDGPKDAPRVVGERHCLTVRKSKVAGKDGRVTKCYFHSSNGLLTPSGFDRARDVLELAERFGLVDRSGAWIRWSGEKWNGEHAAVVALARDGTLLAGLEGEVREKFAEKAPVEHDAETGEMLA